MRAIIMSRIHPADNQCADKYVKEEENCIRNCEHDPYDSPCVLTVWKRSSMSFQGTDGFTVFDSCGQLAFRVDNYTRKDGGGLVLMDGSGNALLTLKPQVVIELITYITTISRTQASHLTHSHSIARGLPCWN